MLPPLYNRPKMRYNGGGGPRAALVNKEEPPVPTDMKKNIAEAVLTLLMERHVKKLTVKDIVEQCHITRQAFYYHFRDILDVIEYILQSSADRLMECCLSAPSVQDALYLFVDFSIENHTFIQRLLDSRQRDSMENLLFHTFRSYMEEMYQNKASEIPINYHDLKVALDFYTYGIAGLLMENISRNTLDRTVLADQMYRLLAGQIILFPTEK